MTLYVDDDSCNADLACFSNETLFIEFTNEYDGLYDLLKNYLQKTNSRICLSLKELELLHNSVPQKAWNKLKNHTYCTKTAPDWTPEPNRISCLPDYEYDYLVRSSTASNTNSDNSSTKIEKVLDNIVKKDNNKRCFNYHELESSKSLIPKDIYNELLKNIRPELSWREKTILRFTDYKALVFVRDGIDKS